MNAPRSQPRCLDAALSYARRGFSVLPLHGVTEDGACTCGKPNCSNAGKHPIGSWKERQTQPLTEEELRNLFMQHPGANVGIVTGKVSGLLVIDIDGEDGQKSFSTLGMGGEPVPVVRTGRGWHVYFAHPGGDVGNFAGTLPGLDGRGDGGYVVAPPSRHASGKTYEWLEDYELDGRPLVQAPDSVMALFKGGQAPNNAQEPSSGGMDFSGVSGGQNGYGTAALADECETVASAPIGQQEQTLSNSALKIGALVKAGNLDADTAGSELVAAGMRMSNEPGRIAWTAAEIENKVRHAFNGANARMPSDKSAKTGKTPAAGNGEGSFGGYGSSDNGHTDTNSFAPLDLSVLKIVQLPAPTFPVELFGDVWEEIVQLGSKATSAPVDYIACTILAVAGSLIGNTRRVKAWGEWIEPAHIWMTLVGNPSAGKSPAINYSFDRLQRVEDELAAGHPEEMMKWYPEKRAAEVRHDMWEKDVKTAIDMGREPPMKPDNAVTPPPPVKPRLIIGDVTIEVVGLIEAGHRRGLLMLSDELAGWLGQMNKYGGKADREFWLEAYNGKRRTIDRVKFNGETIVIRPFDAHPHRRPRTFGRLRQRERPTRCWWPL